MTPLPPIPEHLKGSLDTRKAREQRLAWVKMAFWFGWTRKRIMDEFNIERDTIRRMKLEPELNGRRLRRVGAALGTFFSGEFYNSLPVTTRKELADRASNTGQTITEIMQDDLRNLYNAAD